MPLDTSIALGVQTPQAQPFNPMSIYTAAQDQRLNALRAQALQEEMARNALTMQNTMEDRRFAALSRQQAAAAAAEERRRLGEYRGILGNFGTTPAVTGQRGVGYSGTGVSNDPYAPITTELIRRGFVPQAEELAKFQKEQLAGEETKTKLPGVVAENREKGAKADKAEFSNAFDQMSVLAPYIASGAMPARAAVDAILKHPVAGKLLSNTMTREELYDFADKNPQAVAQILATPPDKIYEALAAPMKYSVQDTAQGIMRVPETGAGPVIPLKGPNNETLTPVDRRSVTNIQNFKPANVTAQEEFIKNVGKQRETFASAPATLENIEKAKELIPDAKAFLGTGGQGMLEAAKFFNNRLGTAIDTKGVSSAEELRSRLFMGVMDNLKKMDAQPTGRQQEALQEAIGQLDTDPKALPKVLDILGDSLRAKVDFYNKDVTEAEKRGVEFPYKPQIDLPAKRTNAASSSLSVTTPDGKVLAFPTAEAAAKFKAAAGIQ